MRFVTEMVMRPSPRPSAWTETRPWRFASNRLISGMLGSTFVASFGASVDELAVLPSRFFSGSPAETRGRI